VDKLPDEALVVRGGRNRPEDIRRGTNTHPSGITGVSVESAPGLSVAELAAAIPHGQVGVTTVGEVRQAGGDVVPTAGRSPHHATLTGLTPDEASRLLTPTNPNPAQDGCGTEGTMDKPRVFADFHNADPQGRLRLNCTGTVEDLARQRIALRDGQWLTLYSEDLEADGQVRYSDAENLWVAVIDWQAIRRQKGLIPEVGGDAA
jgi:hypothetical protein